MTESATINTGAISASELFSGDPNDILLDAGVPRYNRRLTDKILAAFNHAYSSGEVTLARSLWDCLAQAEKVSQQRYTRRRPNQALEMARQWVAFVDSRNAYRAACDGEGGANSDRASAAFRDMKNSYQEWLLLLRGK